MLVLLMLTMLLLLLLLLLLMLLLMLIMLASLPELLVSSHDISSLDSLSLQLQQLLTPKLPMLKLSA
jgi:hypothetical protein